MDYDKENPGVRWSVTWASYNRNGDDEFPSVGRIGDFDTRKEALKHVFEEIHEDARNLLADYDGPDDPKLPDMWKGKTPGELASWATGYDSAHDGRGTLYVTANFMNGVYDKYEITSVETM